MADAALRLPILQGLRMRGDVHQVVYLHEVHALDAQALERGLHLLDALVAAAGVDLGGDEQALAQAELGDQVARDRLGGAVHRRGVDDITIEELQHFAQRCARCRIIADVERLPGAESDFRELHFFLREDAARIEP